MTVSIQQREDLSRYAAGQMNRLIAYAEREQIPLDTVVEEYIAAFSSDLREVHRVIRQAEEAAG